MKVGIFNAAYTIFINDYKYAIITYVIFILGENFMKLVRIQIFFIRNIFKRRHCRLRDLNHQPTRFLS